LGPKALRSPIATGIRATQAHKAGALEFRPAMKIPMPKPTIKAEIAYATTVSIGRSTSNRIDA